MDRGLYDKHFKDVLMGFWSNLYKTKEQIAKEKQEAEAYQSQQQKLALLEKIDSDAVMFKAQNRYELNAKKKRLPIISARNKLVSTLTHFEHERDRLNTAWAVAYAEFSWWNKLKYGEKLDLRELDKQISAVDYALQRFDNVYADEIEKVNAHFAHLIKASNERLTASHEELKRLVEDEKLSTYSSTSVSAAWLAGLSIPVSITGDLYSANAVFDALRGVNGNFENMSNTEIWWETLWMSPESLAGLTSLTKGAYFEQLVAGDTGGELFEHFNHADTDITIDGIEFQLKATDNVGYVNSVDDDIPVITTSEVAAQSAAIDSGYSNEDITNTVDLAVGGTFIDAQDTAIDAILTGVGSLGLFATINGINHAQAQYDKGVAGEEAIFDGLGIAIEGTAKGIVDASEMAYNVATSRPMRFIGRGLLKGLTKLDEKLIQQADTERRQ
jgi:hypothetical protein